MHNCDMNLSIAIATFNEEKNLAKCFDAVKDWAGEIVVVDGGSTDKTVEIAQKYTDKIIITDNPPIFHLNKQKSLDACSGDWILQLDADEIVTPELKKEIIEETRNSQPATQKPINGYFLSRKNYFLGHWLKKGGLYPDYILRLVKKNKAFFPCKSIHEQIKVTGEVGYLKNDFLHYTNSTIADYWKNSIDRNASLTAKEIIKTNKNNSLSLAFNYLIFLPIKWFYLRLIRHKGILDGIYGVIFALGSTLHYPVAYIKYLKLKK